MSPSQSVIPGISESSSVSDMISVLRSSFRKDVFDEVERLLTKKISASEEQQEQLEQELEKMEKERKADIKEKEKLRAEKESMVGDLLTQIKQLQQAVRKELQAMDQVEEASPEASLFAVNETVAAAEVNHQTGTGKPVHITVAAVKEAVARLAPVSGQSSSVNISHGVNGLNATDDSPSIRLPLFDLNLPPQ